MGFNIEKNSSVGRPEVKHEWKKKIISEKIHTLYLPLKFTINLKLL